MKKLFLLLLVFSATISYAQNISFEDDNLRVKLVIANTTTNHYAKNAAGQWIRIDTSGDGIIQQSEALLVIALYIGGGTSITDYNPLPIHSFVGLESFTNLTNLQSRANPLNEPLILNLPQLKGLEISNCALSSVSLSGMNSLENLSCNFNNLTSLDVSVLPLLKNLQCFHNQITSLDFSNNPLLNTVWCYNNQITALDFSNNPLLKSLSCYYNQITSLDFSNNPSLTTLYCVYNQISSLDFSNNPQFNNLLCNNNNLTSLSIKNGVNQNYSNAYNDCWKTGNPNLTTVCADASEVATVQSYLNGCGDTAQVITVVSDCGLMSTEEFGINEIKVFPNPTNSTININGASSIKTIELYDIQGRVLITKEVNANQTNLDISGYTNGVYFVKITTEAGIKREKVIKE